MKKIACLIGLIPLSIGAFSQTPGGTTGSTSGDGVTITPLPTPPNFPNRPKAPSNQHVEASYKDGYMYLNFKYGEGTAVLYIYSADESTLQSQHLFNTESAAAIYVGDLSEAYILIETSYGHQYEGWL